MLNGVEKKRLFKMCVHKKRSKIRALHSQEAHTRISDPAPGVWDIPEGIRGKERGGKRKEKERKRKRKQESQAEKHPGECSVWEQTLQSVGDRTNPFLDGQGELPSQTLPIPVGLGG